MIDATAVLITRELEWPAEARVEGFVSHHVRVKSPNVWERYRIAAECASDDVYVQDDDCEIDIDRLYHVYVREGRRMITNAIPFGHQQNYKDTGVTLIGFGCLFPRKLAVEFVAQRQRWVDVFGETLVDTECDRIFTFVNQPHHNVVMPVREFRRANCMSNRPGHYQVRDSLIKRLHEVCDRA